MKARRGDLAVGVTTRHDYYLGGPRTERFEVEIYRLEVEIYRVTSVSRDGMVKAVQSCWSDSPQQVERMMGHPVFHLIEQDRIDVAAALQVAREHCWEGHPLQPRPFDSLEAVRDALRPLVKVA